MGGGPDPETPSKSILKLNKGELINRIIQLQVESGLTPDDREHLGKQAKDDLVWTCLKLQRGEELAQGDPAPPQTDMAAMIQGLATTSAKATNEANARVDAVLQQMQEERRAADDRMREERRAADDRLARVLEQLAGRETAAPAPVREAATGGTTGQTARPTAKAPPTLEKDVTFKKFIQWRKTWDNYTTVIKLEDQTPEQQVATFRSFCSPELLDKMVHAMSIPDDTRMRLTEILETVEKYLKERRNLALDRLRLVNRKQQEGEAFEDFYVALCVAAGDADLRNMDYDAWMATLITVGISEDETRQKLLAKTPTPKLEETLTLCRNEEKGRLGQGDLKDPKAVIASTGGKSSSGGGKARGRSQSRNRIPTDQKGEKCGQCGWSHKKGECKAKGQACHSCGKKNHFSSVCRSKQVENKTQKQEAVTIAATMARKDMLPVNIYAHKTEGHLACAFAIPDTGAEGTVAGLQLLKDLDIKPNQLKRDSRRTVVGIDGSDLRPMGTLQVDLRLQGRQTTEKITFCHGIEKFYLSREACKRLGIVPPYFPRPMPLEQRAAAVKFPANPTKKEVAKIRAELLEEFSDVFDSSEQLRTMTGAPMRIELKEDAVPFAVHGARPIPYAWRDEVKQMIDDNVAKGIWEPVGDRPTEWCHPLVVVPKPNGRLRICVDLKKLNDQVKRPVHPMKTPREAVAGIPSKARYFSTMDAAHGYWQLELDKESRDLTCFMSPWGRYIHCRSPMGFVASGDGYNLRGDQALAGVCGVEKVVDDILAASESFLEHIQTVRTVLERCRDFGITLNPQKFVFAEEEVSFVGYKISRDGIAADPEKIEAIQKFPEPTNRSELRSFMGVVNQLGQFSDKISGAAGPLRELLKTKNEFLWQPIHTQAMKLVQEALTTTPILAPFDPKAETVLETDASRKKGFGYALLQKQDGRWRLIQCGSRFLTNTETRYAMVELECLAIVYATKKCRLFLAGLPNYTVVTDHRPLLPILNDYTLDRVENTRLLRYKTALSGYQFKVVWRKGQDHAIPDALSRAPVRDPGEEEDLETEAAAMRQTVIRVAVATAHEEEDERLADPAVEKLRLAAKADEDYVALVKAIEEGNETEKTLPFKKILAELTTEDGLILFGHRLVVPKACRKEILERLHDSHQGIERTKRRARQTVYWPGLTSDITNLVEGCTRCQERLPSQPQEPLKEPVRPRRAFESVSADLFSYGGREYMVYVDGLSGYPYVKEWNKSPNASDVMKEMRRYFTDMGVPVELKTDGGPQFRAKEFQDFLGSWGVKSTMSTPHYPQSNGHAESVVKAMKNLVAKATGGKTEDEAFLRGLLEFRNTPRADGRSPNQIVFGHPTRSMVPAHKTSLEKEELVNQRTEELREKRKEHYDQRAHALPDLKVGDTVRLQDPIHKRWKEQGHITETGPNRDYKVELPNGKIRWRNRRFLRLVKTDPRPDGNKKKDDDFTGPRRSERVRKKTVRFAQ